MVKPIDKGKRGEREIATALNAVVDDVRRRFDLPPLEQPAFQRNQNQSAVGGSDLSNPFGLDIEVKRQENLQVDKWWKQAVDQAAKTGGIPVLIYRQSRQQWRVVMYAHVSIFFDSYIICQAEIKFNDFLHWFKYHYTAYLQQQKLVPEGDT